MARPPDRKFVGALGRGLDVLRCFGPRDRWLANQEIAARTGLARPTISRLVYTLTQLGFLRHAHAARKYALGSAAVSLGYSALTQIDIRGAARPYLQALSEQTHASAHLAINDGLHMQVIDTYWHSAVFVIDIGSRVPIAPTSLGRAYVCALPEEERRSVLEQIRLRRPAEWPLARRRLEQAFRDYEQYGFCLALGEWRRGRLPTPPRTAQERDRAAAALAGGELALLASARVSAPSRPARPSSCPRRGAGGSRRGFSAASRPGRA